MNNYCKKLFFVEKTKNTKAFTIVELLVVITLITLLSSLILVAIQNARNKAKDTRIQSDLYQLRSLAELYYQKNL